ncbi:hypothetical protein LIER_32718 [Lithospermum erythrorhizon]|uniref:Vacuolar ATPase assembly protein VMA22 n=1 Tax=Lithospermum erythrorhizon TaxID=34254 RepID=A0AAV3RXR7_LITER
MEEEVEVKHNIESSEDGINQSTEEILKEEMNMINFLILWILYHLYQLSSWLDLASARHSMGASWISSVLFDLKNHNAATSVQYELLLSKSGRAQIQHLSMALKSKSDEQRPENRRSSPVVDDQVHKERFKSRSMFGTLVSPKLRSAQLSFETALDMLVETANIRASLLSAYDEVSKGMNDAK